jgi:hypothetical protein
MLSHCSVNGTKIKNRTTDIRTHTRREFNEVSTVLFNTRINKDRIKTELMKHQVKGSIVGMKKATHLLYVHIVYSQKQKVILKIPQIINGKISY